MKYVSTRGATAQMTFSEVLLRGLAPDGGLMVPAEYPRVDALTLDQWRRMSYGELAFQIMRLYADDIPESDLRYLIDQSYNADTFRSPEITPLKPLKGDLSLLGLSEGPTMAFKDVAMQFLGNAFEYVLTKNKWVLNIIGATSGDTGSSAEYALRGKNAVQVFMLSPNGRMSPFQAAQMYSLDEPNVFNIAVNGTFDDCQDIVKDITNNQIFRVEYRIGNINSINWGRVMAQIVYYFKGYFAATENGAERVSFAVPSGNFGDVLAGHAARMMGLPISRLMVCTNENDVLDEFFTTGEYRPRASSEVRTTSSPSMDIAKASNLERFVFDLTGRNHAEIKTMWSRVEAGKGFELKQDLFEQMSSKFGFVSGRTSHKQRLAAIRKLHEECGVVVDPHTATGVIVAQRLKRPGEKVICMETALPQKFEKTVREALGQDFRLEQDPRWVGVMDKKQKVTVMPADSAAIRMHIKGVLDKQREAAKKKGR